MSQTIFDDIIASSTSGTQLASYLNDFKDAVASGFSGDTSRPTNLQANGYWIKFNNPDDGILTFYIYDGSQDIEVFKINKTTAGIILSDTTDSFSIVKDSDDTLGPLLKLQKNRIAGGGQTLDGDVLGEVEFLGQDGSAIEYTQAKIKAISTDDVTNSTRGGEIAFYVTEDNGSALVEALRITNDKKVGIGTTSPTKILETVGSDSTADHKAVVEVDSTYGPSFIAHKKRVASNGQVASGDIIGNFTTKSTDESGAEINATNIKSVALEQHTSSAGGTKLIIQRVKTGETTLSDIVTMDASGVTVDDALIVTGDLTVQGTTTSVNTTNTEIKDKNITLNNGGDDASSEGAGITVERTGTDGSIIYEDSATSKFKIGAVGSEKEVADISSTQTFTNKTLTSPTINSPSITTPSRLDVKQDTYSNLSTYASSASNGQLCFATDEKKMYQVVDSALTEVGGGGVGDADTIHLINVDDLKSTSDIDLTGNNSDFDGGGTITASSLSLSTTAADLLTGDTVIKYLPAADGSNDYFGFTKSIPIGQRGTELGFQFNYKTTDDTEDEDFRFSVKIKDGASAGDISYYNIDEFYDSNNIGTVFSVSSFIPKDCTEIEFGWQNTDTTTTVGLYLSNILVSQDPFVYKDLIYEQHTELIDANSTVSLSGSSAVFTLTNLSQNEDSLITVANDGPTYTRFKANKACKGNISFAAWLTDNSAYLSVLKNGTVKHRSSRNFQANDRVALSYNFDLDAGDYLSIQLSSGSFRSIGDNFYLSINAIATTDAVVTPMTSPKQYSEANSDFTVTGTNWTTDTAVAMYYVGSDGSHRLKGNIRGHFSSATSSPVVYISGVSLSTTIQQAITCQQLESGSTYLIRAQMWKSGEIDAWFSASQSYFAYSFDVELNSRPTWADPVSSRYLAAVPTAIVTNYADASGQTLTSSSNITWDTKIKDDNNLLNSSTGVWTASKDGAVNVAANVLVDSTTAALIGRFFTIVLVKNSSLFLYGSRDFAYSTATRNYTSIISVNSIPVKKGDTLSIQPVYNIDTPSLYASQDSNSFSVVYNQ